MSSAKPTDNPRSPGALHQFFRLVGVVRPYWSSLLKGVGLSLSIGLLSMVSPYLSKLLIDRVYISHDVSAMQVLILGILGVEVTTAIVGTIRTYFTGYTAFHLTNATALLFFNHLQNLRIRFFEEHRVGEISSRFQEVRNALNAASRIFESVLVNGAYLLLVPVFLFLLQWKLALVAIPAVVLPVLVIFTSGRILRRFHKQSAEAYADLSAFQVEVLTHIRTLKGMALERQMFSRAEGQTRGALRTQLRSLGCAQGFSLLHGLVKAAGTATFTYVAWQLILRQELTLGGYIAFTLYMGFMNAPMLQLTSLFAEFQQSAVSLARMFEYLDQPAEQDPAHVYLPLAPVGQTIRGDIRLRRVTFGHTPERTVLHEVDLEIPAGCVTAIVGPSGAGKSTLLRLVMGMDDPRSGQVLMDGVPVSEMSLTDLRRQVGIVWQEVALLRGTIWDNLTLGAEDPTRERVDEAVRICRLDAMIADLKNGYETSVAEWGSSLSGGQRQRIAIARALVRNTPVLLLDEATANVDMETETAILRDLFAHYEGKTLVFVTHRISTAGLADRICVVEQGRVAGLGTHEHLLRGNDLYRRLCGTAQQDEMKRIRVMQPT